MVPFVIHICERQENIKIKIKIKINGSTVLTIDLSGTDVAVVKINHTKHNFFLNFEFLVFFHFDAKSIWAFCRTGDKH